MDPARRDAGVPRTHFGVGTGELLTAMGEAGADVVGVDWRVPLDEATRRVGPDRALQGNLDPAVLFAGPDVVETEVRRIVDESEQPNTTEASRANTTAMSRPR